MSETMLRDPRQPVRRTPGIRLDIPLDAEETPEKIAWTAAFLQILGVTSKRDTQGALQMDILAVCKTMEEQTLPADPLENPYCAANLTDEAGLPLPAGLKPGPEFMAYLKALKDYEAAEIPRPSKVIATLRAKAQGYLDHYDAHPKLIQSQPQNLRKKMLCENTIAELRRYELRDQVQALGNPPWDSPKSMQAASLKAEADFVSMNNAPAEVLGGDHVSPAFWINRAAENGKPAKSFIFKPTSVDSGIGIPSGGETAREAAAGRLGDLLKGATGIDLGVPETHVVALPKERFPADALNKVAQTDPLVGSLQQFARTDGDLRSQSQAERNKIPATECQKMVIFDVLALNLDRHSGNLLITNTSGTPVITPIDHGQTFPDAQNPSTIGQITTQLGDRFNATLGLPGAHEPFSKEMLEGIERLDPIALKQAMKTEVGDLEKAFPGTGNTISEASIEMSRRSAMFLKLAAPKMSPASVQVALGQNAAELFDPTLSDDAFTVKAQAIVVTAVGQQEALAAYFCMTKGEQVIMEKALRDNGWPVNDRKWMLTNPSRALALYQGNVRNPVMMQNLTDKLGSDVLNRMLKHYTLVTINQYQDNTAKLPDLGDMTDDKRQQELGELRKAFPNFTVYDETDALVAWKRFTDAGGMQALKTAEDKLKASAGAIKAARDSVEIALEQILKASSLVALNDEQRDAKLRALKTAFPDEKLNPADPWQVSQAISRWDAILGFEYADQKGPAAVKVAADGMQKKLVPQDLSSAESIIANAKSLLQVWSAKEELDELDKVWPQGNANPVQQAKSLAMWREFKSLGGQSTLDNAIKDMSFPRSDIKSLEKGLETLRLYAASGIAMNGVQQQNPDAMIAAAPVVVLRKSAKLFLPPGHAVYSRIDDLQGYSGATSEQKALFTRTVQALRVVVIDAIRAFLTSSMSAFRQRRDILAKTMPADERGRLDTRLDNLARSISGGKYDAALAREVKEIARQVG